MVMPLQKLDTRRVVVVEDDPTIGVLIASILAEEGYAPIVVPDGRQALRVVREIRPDAITLDLELPGMNGRDLLRRLVDVEPSRPLPVVVISASTEVLSRDERRLVARTLSKPFDLFDLVRAVDDVVTKC